MVVIGVDREGGFLMVDLTLREAVDRRGGERFS